MANLKGVAAIQGEIVGLEVERDLGVCRCNIYHRKEEGPRPAFLCPQLWTGGAKLPGDCSVLLGDHARPKDDLARALFHLHGLQDAHSEQGLLHGGRRTLLRAR